MIILSYYSDIIYQVSLLFTKTKIDKGSSKVLNTYNYSVTNEFHIDPLEVHLRVLLQTRTTVLRAISVRLPC